MLNPHVTRALLLVVTCLCWPLLAAHTVAIAQAATDGPSLGVSTTFAEGSVIDMLPGQKLPGVQSLRVDNAGNRPAEVQWAAKAPVGITVNTPRDQATIPVGESVEFPFSIEVAETAAGGDYEVALTVKQTNVPQPKAGGLAVAPAVGGSLVVHVSGASAEVRLSAVNSTGGPPMNGRLTLSQIRGKRPPVPVASEVTDVLQVRVAPGDYRGRFEIEGLVEEELDFSVADGETKDVVIEVTTLSFIVAAAQPQPDLDHLTTAKLVTSIQNSIKRIPGPLALSVEVAKDGVPLETVDMQRFDSLPHGLTEATETYVPVTGWSPGQYDFTFVLKGSDFAITSPAQKPIVVPSSWLIPLAIGVGVLAVIAGVIAIIRRRRRRDAGRGSHSTDVPVGSTPIRGAHLQAPPPSGPPFPDPPDDR